jgi:protein phosphatase slingshot
LTIITCTETHRESALVGFDCVNNEEISIGVTIPLINGQFTNQLDGDGGLLVKYASVFYVFKPVSIQLMWFAFQNVHKELRRVSYTIGQYHNWLLFYQQFATTDDSLCVQWQTSLVDEDAESLKETVDYSPEKRSPAEMEIEAMISKKLRQIMRSVDLNEVTTGEIRKRLEEECGDYQLSAHKSFIDRKILQILGQMEGPTKLFDYLFLGDEWSAANYEDLVSNKLVFWV